MILKRICEVDLSEEERKSIINLRAKCFDAEFCENEYYKQLPHLRILGYLDGKLVSQCGIDYRIISVGGTKFRVVFMVDLCTDPELQGRGYGALIIESVKAYVLRDNVEFVIAVAENSRFYENNGFKHTENFCTWLRIDNGQNFGVAFESLKGELMYYGELDFPKDGLVDFLGPLCVTDHSRTLLPVQYRSERRGLSANFVFHTRGVSSRMSLAG